MRMVSMVYTDGDIHHRTDRFLSKEKLREIFPEAEYVTLGLQMHRRRFSRKSGEAVGGKRGKKTSKKTGYSENPKSPYTRLRHKVVWLG